MGLWEEEQICPICTRNSRYGLPHKYCHKSYGLDGLTCLWSYDGVAKKIIKKAKYKYFYDMLSELLVHGSWFIDRPELSYFLKFLENNPTSPEASLGARPVVVSVPLHERRYRERGFNQAEIVAKSFAARHNLSYDGHLLLRTRDTGHQAGRERGERLKAVEGAFSLALGTEPLALPKAVLLVDDVWTTGATMSECCKILKTNGAKQVWGLVLAR